MQTFTVYLGSAGAARDIFKQQACLLGDILAREDKHLIYGGMNAGLMGLLAQHALRGGGAVTGIIPRKLQDSERIMEGLTRTLLVEELCDRKRLMFEECDVVVCLPGGFGTLDETLEALYWGSLKMHSKPIVLVNIDGYWDKMMAFLKSLPDYDDRYCIIVDDVEGILPALEAWDKLPPIQTPAHLPHFEDEISRDTLQAIVIDKPTLENAYFVTCAMGLKQLDKHQRPIGLINAGGVYDDFITWAKNAQAEHFITAKCLTLFDSAPDEDQLRALLKHQSRPDIDLHAEKWGEAISGE
ncbi:MAG: TIGR00730 family Rossman fold protein [Alphaproteobacteria bacterium]|nr:TIGR00730 family Rossman fold protein [Alphaproteobacteria bacterium]HCQ70629.1 TIGR00730 family Rossman fold protein [Rhodospirillaceae bacterium]|tara:strand:- start:13361 stop:14254 length:894 start_codon:yes stop_codon:yes gene_type:complete